MAGRRLVGTSLAVDIAGRGSSSWEAGNGEPRLSGVRLSRGGCRDAGVSSGRPTVGVE